MILDTNALSAFADGIPQVGAAIKSTPELVIPVTVLGEYRYGISHSVRRPAYEAWLERYLPIFVILEITRETTLEYAAVRSELRSIGKPIPANDAWIAALCREHNLPILSRDQHFDRVPGIRRMTW
jgi:tRNA(fMet)-specific endonuclease VapC